MSLLLLLTATIICYYVVAYLQRVREERKIKTPYSKTRWVDKLPFGLDGAYRVIHTNLNYQLPTHVLDYANKYHTYSMCRLGDAQVFTQDVKNVQAILATQFSDFGYGTARKPFEILLGHRGIFTQDGSDWAHSRALLRPQFVREQVADLHQLESSCQNLVTKLEKLVSKDYGGAVDLQPLFHQLTLDVSTAFLLNESVESLKSENGHEFEKAFDLAVEAIGLRTFLGAFSWVYNPPSLRRANKIVDRFVFGYVDDAIRQQRMNQQFEEEQEVPEKQRYVFLQELAKVTQDRDMLRDQVLNILLAGRDTTAALLSWTFLCLVRYPKVQAALRKDIENVAGNKIPSQEELRNMQYLQWVIKEVLRLFPSVPMNARQALKTTTIPRGGGPDRDQPVLVRKGENVTWSVFTLHRDESLYGSDAAEFRPERWGEENVRKVGWGYLPFNGGPRICLGQQFAITTAGFAIVRLLQNFTKFEDASGITGKTEDVGYELNLIMRPAGGVRVNCQRAGM